MEDIIKIKGLRKEYNGFLALDDVSLRIKKR